MAASAHRQRFEQARDQFSRAVTRLAEVAELDEDDVVRDALIQRFELSYELARKTLFHCLRDQGEQVQDMARPILQQDTLDEDFRRNLERDKRVFWEARRGRAEVEHLGGVVMKPFQSEVLTQLGRFLDELKKQRAQADRASEALRVAEIDVPKDMADYPRKAWGAMRDAQLLPPAFARLDYTSRFDEAGQPIPNACLKVPTGGGKTLLAAASVARTFSSFLGKHTGLVLWIVPNEAIYEQTRKALTDRDHPYRQMLNVAGAGRVKILEKNSPLSRLDVESHLCVMLLMLQSAARRSKETLRFFRDRGNVLGLSAARDLGGRRYPPGAGLLQRRDGADRLAGGEHRGAVRRLDAGPAQRARSKSASASRSWTNRTRLRRHSSKPGKSAWIVHALCAPCWTWCPTRGSCGAGSRKC